MWRTIEIEIPTLLRDVEALISALSEWNVPMTVAELIDLLSSYPGDLRVVVDGYEDGFDDLNPELIGQIELALNQNEPWYLGRHEASDNLVDAESAGERVHAIVLRRPNHDED